MKHLMLLLLGSIAITGACVDTSRPATDEQPEALTSTRDDAQTDITCQVLVECEVICYNVDPRTGRLTGRSGDVTHEYCSDGSDTILGRAPCSTIGCS